MYMCMYVCMDMHDLLNFPLELEGYANMLRQFSFNLHVCVHACVYFCTAPSPSPSLSPSLSPSPSLSSSPSLTPSFPYMLLSRANSSGEIHTHLGGHKHTHTTHAMHKYMHRHETKTHKTHTNTQKHTWGETERANKLFRYSCSPKIGTDCLPAPSEAPF